MDSAPSLAASDTVAANLRVILRGLLAALGAWRVETVIAVVLYRRISGAIRQIERMLMRFRAGTLRHQPHRFVPKPQMHRKPAARLPQRFGWRVQKGGYQAACAGSQLLAVLNTPEMAELLAASAQARRVLRPLCRALAVELPWVAGTTRQVSTRKTRLRSVPEPFRIPLPRSVLTAARRDGFGKAI